MSIEIKLEVFEGPLDLLLKLIEKSKIDIYNIPIARLTDDYLRYISKLDKASLEEMSEFILMAATLLHIKSKLLLPKPENKEELKQQEEEKEELVQKLIEYKKYKTIAEKLSEREVFAQKAFFKKQDTNFIDYVKIKQDNIDLKEILKDIDLKTLHNIFENLLKIKDLKTDKIRSSFNSIRKSLYNINDKIAYIKDLIYLNERLNFNKIIDKSRSKEEVIVTFLAILELTKLKNIKIVQEDMFDEIIILKGDKDG